MRSSWGRNIVYSLFGESHGQGIGITIHHLPAGFKPNLEKIRTELDRRRPGTGAHSTPRSETDTYEWLSGYFEEHLTGAPVTAFFKNSDTRSKDYSELIRKPRPSHADYAASIKYHGFNDYRGGGHFSGRLTAPVVFAGALAAQLLEKKGIKIFGHILQIGKIKDKPFDAVGNHLTDSLSQILKNRSLSFVDEDAMHMAEEELEAAKAQHDSIGGSIEIAVTGIPIGLGEPIFDSLESTLAHLMFSIPGVKAVEFGAGKDFADMMGSQANDCFKEIDNRIYTETNHSGGINGGISNGMPLIVKITFRPTPSISKPQTTINRETGSMDILEIKGRHDPCIVPRACPVVESMAAIGLLEALLDFESLAGEDWR